MMHKAFAFACGIWPLLCATPVVAQIKSGAGPIPVDQESWLDARDYPAHKPVESAIGVVGFSLDVNSEGMPTECTVLKSSGKDFLDKLTCRVLLKKARFVAAKNSEGRSVSSVYGSKIRWNGAPDFTFNLLSPVEAAAKHEQGTTNVRITRTGRDAVPDCTVTISSDFPDLDEATCATFQKMDRSKMPAKKTFTVEVSWKLPTNGSAMAN